jgi:hypothetical protein
MNNTWILALQYLISAEDSRLGRQNHWQEVFLAGLKPLNRNGLALCKLMVLMVLSTGIMMVLAQL